MSRGKHFVQYRLPAVLWAFVIFALSSIPSAKLPHFILLKFDKLVHAGFFFILGILVYRAFEPRIPTISFNWRRLILAVSIVVLYGIFDEVHQGFVPGRTVDVLDTVADSIGGLLAAVLIYIRHRIRKVPPTH
jgi:VanZ family protein